MGIFSRAPQRKVSVRSRGGKTPLLPASLQSFLAHRLTDLGGLALAAAGLSVFGALLTYDAKDPSLNTAGTNPVVSNLLGKPGAYAADLLLQTLGAAALLLGVAFLVWGWRVVSRKKMPPASLRVPMLFASVLLGAIAFARLPSFDMFGTGAYLGGSAGALIYNAVGNNLQGWLGTMAFLFVALSAAMLGAVTYIIALGIGLGEWMNGLGTTREVTAYAAERTGAAFTAFRKWHTTYTNDAPPKQRRIRIKEDASPEQDDVRETDDTLVAKRKPIVAIRSEKPQKPVKEDKQKKLNLRTSEEEWQLPALDLLQDRAQSVTKLDENALQKNAEMLQSTLADFGVQGDILKVSPGPIVTLYEMEPAPGTKTSRVIGLSDDIARSMSSIAVRVAVVPGKNAIGIELPNAKREMVFLKELLATRESEKHTAKLPLILGKNIAGEPVIADLARMPHLLVAGTTGSGKSVAVNTMILSLLYRLSPEQCRFIMIDPKMLELSVYDEIPHLLTPVVTEAHKAVTALKWAVREMEDRYRAMSKLGVRNIDGFNERIRAARASGEVLMHKIQTGFDSDTGKPVYEEQPIPLNDLPYIVIIVDEFADLMLVAGKEVENAIQRLAQMARAAGIHLIMATQRPSVDVITGVIKANFPTRISFQVTSKIDSRTILGEGGAEQLLGQGDMLYMAAGGRITRVHGPFVGDDEVEKIVSFLRSQGVPNYIDGVTDGEEEEGGFGEAGSGGGSGDDLYDQAVAIVIRERKVSTSFIQRHLQIGYNRAARIVERMEKEGLITAANHVGKREILGGDHYGT
ncbi:MAG TPA: DNA translocase FtsK 4TM domain-containing protein [Patescibacteria group bacterium]|nr:DNA translocase FtsK 4TM domain-containing protein [Patescibacteria group bacterium]